MDSTSALCIFCGRDRSVTDDTCPSCGRGWVDRRVTGAIAGLTAAARGTPTGDAPADASGDAATGPTTGPGPAPAAVDEPIAGTEPEPATPPQPDDPSDPPTFEENLHPPIVAAATTTATETDSTGDAAASSGTDDSRRRAVTQQLLIGAAVVGVVVAWFVVLAWITGQDGESPSVLPSTTISDTGSTETTVTAPDTTVPTTTEAPTSTTAAPTTTLPPIEPEGDPIAASDLALGAFALGPLDFGSTGALPRLVATFGQPDAMLEAGADLGLCEPDSGVAATWGPLTAVFEGSGEEAVLVGYRLEVDGGHAAAALATLSGLEVGDTVADLETVYDGFTVAYEDIDGVPSYIVIRTADDVTLLWGPVSSTEDGTVEGIYSPLPCDGGPTVPS